MSDQQEKSGAVPGVQQKFSAVQRPDGIYEVRDNINTDPIPSFRVIVRDPAALYAALHATPEPGPPSIVDVIIARRDGVV